jgi:hypothetical protein
MSTGNCKNCDRQLPGQAEYCPVCGQSVKEINRPWLVAGKELLSDLLDIDGRMLKSFRLLLTRPGFLSHEFNHGRRVSYTSPIRMYLIISLGFFLVLPMILPESSVTSPDHELSQDLFSKTMFLLLPLFALLLKIFYRSSFYLAHLVTSVYLFSAMYLVMGLMLILEPLTELYSAAIVVQVAVFAAGSLYVITTLRVTYEEGWLPSGLKFVALLMLFLPVLAVAIEMVSHIPSLPGNAS